MEFLFILLGIFGVMVALATLVGWFEDLESDVGSQSNPNSQVQLAPQVGNPHRIFNKAISGEPASHGFYGAIAGTLFAIFLQFFKWPVIVSLPIACGLTALVHMSLATTAHVGRTTSHNIFGQPLYLDVLVGQLPLIAAYGFVCTTLYTTMAYIFYSTAFSALGIYLGYPVAIPIISFMLGLIAGSVGSSTGDTHYGAEREFQHTTFGEGIAMAHHGNITVKSELGYRTSNDIVYFCAKYGGPMAGLCYGLIFLLDNFRLILGNLFFPAVNIAVGLTIIVVLLFINRRVEVFARRKFGTYEE
ncbi:MAG: tetrahydromethanopterin S-methyltransferase subunit E [Candidatus Bathyarchaeota archaeon]